MFVLMGWCQLSASTNDVPLERDRVLLSWVQAEIAARGFDDFATAHYLNGEPVLTANCVVNHDAGLLADWKNFLGVLGRQGPGSHGIFFESDDEGDHPDSYRLLILVRGEVHEREDPYFSPFIPTIEDE